MTKITDWTGAYDLGWKGLICDEAFSHPAKYSRALIFKIIEYALQNELIQPGQVVVDPFGGVALGALPSLMNGLSWVGCELEERFCLLGRKNIDLWNGKFSSMPKWTGSAQLLQGDSRRLAEVIAGAGLVVGSPPYSVAGLGNAAAYKDPDKLQKEIDRVNGMKVAAGGSFYGTSPGQLGTMPPGSLSAVISSPPFAGNTGGRGEASRNGIDAALFDRHSGGMKKGTGSDPANLDHLPMGTVGAVIGSPPYSATHIADITTKRIGDSSLPVWKQTDGDNYGSTNGQLGAMVVGSPPFSTPGNQPTGQGQGVRSDYKNGKRTAESPETNYGSTEGQLGQEFPETFWAAARLIVDQCHQILPDNAAAIWVVKSYVKNGKVVDFPGQWQALCEACGFETVEIIRAWLVKRNGAQGTIEGGTVNKDVARKSFFRRLAEKNGSPPIDYETVLVTRKKGVPQ